MKWKPFSIFNRSACSPLFLLPFANSVLEYSVFFFTTMNLLIRNLLPMEKNRIELYKYLEQKYSIYKKGKKSRKCSKILVTNAFIHISQKKKTYYGLASINQFFEKSMRPRKNTTKLHRLIYELVICYINLVCLIKL